MYANVSSRQSLTPAVSCYKNDLGIAQRSNGIVPRRRNMIYFCRIQTSNFDPRNGSAFRRNAEIIEEFLADSHSAETVFPQYRIRIRLIMLPRCEPPRNFAVASLFTPDLIFMLATSLIDENARSYAPGIISVRDRAAAFPYVALRPRNTSCNIEMHVSDIVLPFRELKSVTRYARGRRLTRTGGKFISRRFSVNKASQIRILGKWRDTRRPRPRFPRVSEISRKIRDFSIPITYFHYCPLIIRNRSTIPSNCSI